MKGLHTFGEFTLDPARYELRRGEEVLRLQPKTWDVLRYLVDNPGRLVTKDELLAAVWPGVIVTENSLTRCIMEVRRVLDDDVASPRCIETVPRRGYRWIAVVQEPIESTEPADVAAVALQVQAVPPDAGVATDPSPSIPISPLRRARGRVGLLALGVVTALVVVLWFVYRPRPTGPDSLAVLPLTNLSSEADLQYLADGMTEDLIDAFARTGGLKVVSRTSSFALGKGAHDPQALASTLGVRWLLTGSLRREDQQLRVNLELVEAGSGYQAWSGGFTRGLDGLREMQLEIVTTVLAQIAPQLEPARLPYAASAGSSFDAYQAFLLGRDYFNRRPPGWEPRARSAFEAAIKADPGLARAHAGFSLVESATAYYSSDPAASRERAQAAARRALEIDPDLALGHAALGLLELVQPDADAAAAERHLRRALELDPALVDARLWLADALTVAGRAAEARMQLSQALVTDPLNPGPLLKLARNYSAAGDYANARRMFDRLLQLPQPPVGAALGLFNLSRSYGRLADALHWAREFARTAPAEHGARPGLLEADVWARLGRPREALALIEKATADELPSGWQDSLEIALRRLGRVEDTVRILSPRGAPRSAEDPRNAALARARILSGDYAVGAAVLEGDFPLGTFAGRARAGDPAAIDTWQAYAYALQQLGRGDEARRQLEALLALQQRAVAAGRPGEPDIRVQHALTFELLGRDDEALALFDEARRLGWVDHFFVRNDRRWDRLGRDPRLQAVLDAAAADVARQAARLTIRAST